MFIKSCPHKYNFTPYNPSSEGRIYQIQKQSLKVRLTYLEASKVVLIGLTDCQIAQALNNTTYITGFRLRQTTITFVNESNKHLKTILLQTILILDTFANYYLGLTSMKLVTMSINLKIPLDRAYGLYNLSDYLGNV